MEWDYIWKAMLIVLGGTFLIRIAGRKTISQMTLAETVLMIAIGSLLIQPVSGKNIWLTLSIGAVLVSTLLVLEYIQMKSDKLEKLITGKAKVIIENGTLNEKNLMKLRLSVDQLEMMLRQSNVTSIRDVKWATLEPNGQLGFELKEDAKPVTKKDFNELKQIILDLFPNHTQLTELNKNLEEIKLANTKAKENIFSEVDQKSHTTTPPKRLQ